MFTTMTGPDASDAPGADADDAPGGRVEESLARAEDRLKASPAGIGAAAVYSGFQNGEHIWDCIVVDGREWHYVRVIGSDLGPYPGLSPEDVEGGIERFAATLPAQNRILQLLGANPLHTDRQGNVED
jgi:hypothetical protein